MRQARVTVRMSEAEKALLLALRTLDGATEADEIAKLMREEARRRLANGRGTREITEALAAMEQETRGAGGSPPKLGRRLKE